MTILHLKTTCATRTGHIVHLLALPFLLALPVQIDAQGAVPSDVLEGINALCREFHKDYDGPMMQNLVRGCVEYQIDASERIQMLPDDRMIRIMLEMCTNEYLSSGWYAVFSCTLLVRPHLLEE